MHHIGVQLHPEQNQVQYGEACVCGCTCVSMLCWLSHAVLAQMV